MPVSKNKVVAIDYKLTNEDGRVLDTSEGSGPLTYLHGVGTILPALEEALEGTDSGQQVQVTIPADKGYGQRNEQLQQEVARENFGQVEDLEVGMRFRVQTNAGEMVVRVVDVQDSVITIDGNHPLAGEDLNFDVTVREVRDATEEELQHGHAH